MQDPGRPLVAFLGPSLRADVARAIAPDVELLPPVCRGDLAAAVERLRPRAVLIVDGEFADALAVRHKEILHALHLGLRVLGASSVGALRAAELDRFGMEGVGEIYAHYRDGRLTSDAEVALMHLTAAEGYRPLSWPMVNVRATVSALAARDAIGAGAAAAVLAAAARLHFIERTRPALAHALAGDGCGEERAEALAALVEREHVDLKARDAAAAFERLARLDAAGNPDAPGPPGDVALRDAGFQALLDRAIDRRLVAQVAEDMGIEPSADELARQRARVLRRLGVGEDSAASWLLASGLDERRFEDLVVQLAQVQQLRRRLLDAGLLERNRRLVIEQLQLEGAYAPANGDREHRRAPRGPEAVHDAGNRSRLEAHQVTEALLAAVELGVAGALAAGPRTTEELASALGADARRLERLLASLAGLGLLAAEDGAWRLSAAGRRLATTSGAERSAASRP